MLVRQQLRDTTKTEAAVQLDTADSDTTDIRVTDVNTGIAEVLNMRVGCWRAPVHLWTEPTAAYRPPYRGFTGTSYCHYSLGSTATGGVQHGEVAVEGSGAAKSAVLRSEKGNR